MTTEKFSYDPECAALAEHFLWDEEWLKPTHRRVVVPLLAQAIQDAVELWLTGQPDADTVAAITKASEVA